MYEAVQTAVRFIVRGYSVDLGLMQVNSRNLPKLGLSVTQVFDPCNNIRTGASILTAAYAAAARIQGDGQPALRAALSAYNTGDFYRGQVNGYVAGYYRPSGVPAIAGGVHENPAPVPPRHDRVAATANPYTADTSIFAREPANVRIE
jgi:type IV secretion system protein VirB1